MQQRQEWFPFPLCVTAEQSVGEGAPACPAAGGEGGRGYPRCRPASRAETTPLPKRQPSPAPSPKPTPTPEPKPAPTPVEAEAIVAKPAAKVEPKAESRQKAMALSRSPEVPAESLELEVTTLQKCWRETPPPQLGPEIRKEEEEASRRSPQLF
ncbi:protein TonB-like [Trematomus bernacchii]|uniref:protein TonB-like n=1 Tax=Trematomus bernacchii TaxID=40690 RepID=UPI001469E21F|nr:protein TonB-like [Trematomus bernacchii]